MKKEKMQKQIESMIPTPQQIVEHLDKKQEEAKRLYATANADQKYVLERLFPQLKGSEDERIRKAIVLFFELQDDNTTYSFIPKKDILSWLEKQGEQKPADKVEPKFKVGDWVTNSIETVQITGYDIDYGYQVDYKGNLQHRDTDIIEKEYHLWTIQDAKDGDILACNNDILSICIFSHFDGINNKYDSFLCHCGLEGEGLGQELNINGYHDDSTGYVPATKEQRDLLFQKMKEAGCAFGFVKKELKKIEQNPTWGEEDERIRKELHEHCRKQADIYNTLHTAKEYCKVQSWVAWLEKQGEQKPTDEEMKTTLRTEYEKGRADVIDEMRKAAWSEEDEQTFIKSVEALEDFGKFELADWLKEHKNQFLRPQNTLETE